MHISMTLPTSVLGPLRQGAYVALRSPLEEIVHILAREEPRSSRRSLIESHARFMQISRLLDDLGWSEGEALSESTIDLSEHGGALAEALDNALKAGIKDLEHPDRQVCKQVGQAMRALCGFAMAIDEADLERSQRDPRVRAFHESAEALLTELERECAEHS